MGCLWFWITNMFMLLEIQVWVALRSWVRRLCKVCPHLQQPRAHWTQIVIQVYLHLYKNEQNYQSTFKIIFRPALSQGKLFHVENQRELVTMANLQTRKMYCLFVFFLDLVILLVPQHIPFEETVRYSPAKHPQIEANWERMNVTVNRTWRKHSSFPTCREALVYWVSWHREE